MHKLTLLAPALSLAALLMVPLPGSAQDNAATPFRQFQDARNGGELEAAMAVVASDVQYVDDGPVCSSASPCGGNQAFRRDVQLSISDHVFTSVVGSVEVSGPTLQVRLLSVSPGRADIGVERTFSEVTMELVDGQITSWRSMSDLADPQTVWWLDHRPAARSIP
jgi:hypothetical protein